jgi:hypothetical protein
MTIGPSIAIIGKTALQLYCPGKAVLPDLPFRGISLHRHGDLNSRVSAYGGSEWNGGINIGGRNMRVYVSVKGGYSS